MARWFSFKKTADSNPRWYEDASPRQRQEYDAFGPWVYEVNSAEATPVIYDPWYPANAGARLVLKFPVEIERRQARPGQNLYRSLLAVHDDFVCQLSLVDGQVEERIIQVAEIQAIRHYRCLLAGEFSLYLADGQIYSLKYNSVSYDLVDQLVTLLRQRISGQVGQIVENVPKPLLSDYYYQVVLDGLLRREPGLKLVHFEQPGKRCLSPEGRRRSRLGILVMENGPELLLIDRGAAFRRASVANYASATIYLPRRSIRSWGLDRVNQKLEQAGQSFKLFLQNHQIERILFEDAQDLGGNLVTHGIPRL